MQIWLILREGEGLLNGRNWLQSDEKSVSNLATDQNENILFAVVRHMQRKANLNSYLNRTLD